MFSRVPLVKRGLDRERTADTKSATRRDKNPGEDDPSSFSLGFLYYFEEATKMRFKKGLFLVLVIVALSIVSACGGNNGEASTSPSDSATDSPSSASAKPVTLRVGYNLWVGSAGTYIADKLGYFKDAGLDIKFIEFPNPTESTQALLTGNVDISGTTLDTAVMVKSTEQPGQDLKFFHIGDQSFGADGIVSKDSITSIADLKGKTVAVTIGAVNHFLLSHALKQAGVNESDVNLTNVSPEQTGALFLTGKVDAAVTWEPYLSEAKSKGGKILYSTKDAPNLIIDGDMASQKLITEQGDALRKYAAAIEKGRQYYLDHPDEGAQIVADKLQTTKEEVKSMMEGVKLASESDSKTILVDNKADLEKLITEFSTFFKDSKLIEKDVDPATLIDTSLYQ
jgi:NitT/TauT family transport system substrate-binding protein